MTFTLIAPTTKTIIHKGINVATANKDAMSFPFYHKLRGENLVKFQLLIQQVQIDDFYEKYMYFHL